MPKIRLAPWLLPVSLIFTFAIPQSVRGQTGVSDGSWRYYGGDSGSTKYSDLDHINRGNLEGLNVVWMWDSVDNSILSANDNLAAATFKATPLFVDGALFIRTNLSQVAAIDGRTGDPLWSFDPESWRSGRPPNYGFNSRGVAYWEEGPVKRILLGTGDAYLWAIDAERGEPDPSFGNQGRIDLTEGMRREFERGEYSSLSPPIVVGDVIVIGSSISDGPRYRTAPPGDVRGFDVRTGKLLWTFQTVPQAGEFGNESWQGESALYTGATNAWTLLSADLERGYVYVPVGTPTNDWFGGHRLGDNLFAESLVALDAATGERVWHFQFVHHGVWDYDLPAAPNLVNLPGPNGMIPAVAQVTKQGFVFLFNRESGEPIFPIEERAVPPSAIPGEALSPTQPFPTRPPPFERQGIRADDVIDFSPELRQRAEAILEGVDHGPLYQPPSERGTLNLPGWLGGADWEGAAVDPDRAVLYVPSRTMPIRVQLVRPDPERSDFEWMRGGSGSLGGPDGLPLVKPPYARLTAIDLKEGEILWQTPIGDGPRQQLIEMGIADPGPLGGGSFTGPLLTPDLLILGHTGARDGNGMADSSALLFFDPGSGERLFALPLPHPPTGTPMTYSVGDHQYVAVAFGQGEDAGLMAVGLP